MTTDAADATVDEVNGPEGPVLDWDAIDWRACEEEVGRLRRRIFKASQDGDRAKVQNLQKLMLRSRSNALVSVRQVTQRNAGRWTPGIDHQVALTSQDRAELATRMIGGELATWPRFFTGVTGSSSELQPCHFDHGLRFGGRSAGDWRVGG